MTRENTGAEPDPVDTAEEAAEEAAEEYVRRNSRGHLSFADGELVTTFAPGRVNLIGDHTDTTGGLAMPMAIDLGTTVTGTVLHRSHEVRLRSDQTSEPAVVRLDVGEPSAATPPWARYVAGVVAELRPRYGFDGTVSTTLPVGAGLSSSAALEVALALALGLNADALTVAKLCQLAEHAACGVPCGIMDQLTSVAGVEGSALMLDCHSLSVTPVPLPEGCEVVVVHSGQDRVLAGSGYAERRRQCVQAQDTMGTLLRKATADDAEKLTDPLLRRRTRHVVNENQRVRAFAQALGAEDLGAAGRMMAESHASLRDDFEVSTPTVDALVERLAALDGVYGARMTGGGFGGCVVALTRPGALDEGRVVRASAGALLRDS